MSLQHHAYDLRSLYMPAQPTVKQSGSDVTYREFLPHEKLQPYIYCYWQLSTCQPLTSDFIYRVVADGCIDIYFELSKPEESYVMGFCKKYTQFSIGNNFNYVGVRFLPAMFPQLFKVNAAELSNRYEALENVIPQTAQFIADSFTNPDNTDLAQVFDDYFLQHLAHTHLSFDNRLYEALHIILKNFGVLDVQTDLDTGISPRQLRRLFEYYIGDSIKTFSNVVRFQNILRSKPSSQSLRQNKLFYNAGYYDQAHFIKEFKNFYGVTPAKAFGRE